MGVNLLYVDATRRLSRYGVETSLKIPCYPCYNKMNNRVLYY